MPFFRPLFPPDIKLERRTLPTDSGTALIIPLPLRAASPFCHRAETRQAYVQGQKDTHRRQVQIYRRKAQGRKTCGTQEDSQKGRRPKTPREENG